MERLTTEQQELAHKLMPKQKDGKLVFEPPKDMPRGYHTIVADKRCVTYYVWALGGVKETQSRLKSWWYRLTA